MKQSISHQTISQIVHDIAHASSGLETGKSDKVYCLIIPSEKEIGRARDRRYAKQTTPSSSNRRLGGIRVPPEGKLASTPRYGAGGAVVSRAAPYPF